MSLRDKIENVLSDFLPDKEEREGILNNILFYTYRHSRGAFTAGVCVGFIAMALLLKWLA